MIRQRPIDTNLHWVNKLYTFTNLVFDDRTFAPPPPSSPGSIRPLGFRVLHINEEKTLNFDLKKFTNFLLRYI